MATQSIILTTTPKNIVSELGLLEGESYRIQCISVRRIFLAELAEMPDSSNRDTHVYEYLDKDSYTIAIDPLYGWTEAGEGKLSLTEEV